MKYWKIEIPGNNCIHCNENDVDKIKIRLIDTSKKEDVECYSLKQVLKNMKGRK